MLPNTTVLAANLVRERYSTSHCVSGCCLSAVLSLLAMRRHPTLVFPQHEMHNAVCSVGLFGGADANGVTHVMAAHTVQVMRMGTLAGLKTKYVTHAGRVKYWTSTGEGRVKWGRAIEKSSAQMAELKSQILLEAGRKPVCTGYAFVRESCVYSVKPHALCGVSSQCVCTFVDVCRLAR
jgi:hypothetical protein